MKKTKLPSEGSDFFDSELKDKCHTIYEKLFVAMYNPMIHESCYGVISIHRTRKNAEMAMEFHKSNCKKEWDKYNSERDKKDDFDYFQFGQFEAWNVFEFELKD